MSLIDVVALMFWIEYQLIMDIVGNDVLVDLAEEGTIQASTWLWNVGELSVSA